MFFSNLAEVIALAGQPARVTVATNMAGRGTDIRFGPGVAERGGLHVILTEYHELRRIDRQFFGRCARQGDPGSCEAIVLLDDELYTVYASWRDRAHRAGGVHKAVVTVVDQVCEAASGTIGVRLELANPGYLIPAGLKCHVRFGGIG